MIRSSASRSVVAFMIYLLLPGCGYMTTIMRPYDAKKTSVAIDAKQRVVISGGPQTVKADAGKRLLPVVCAEPSPDALSALSSGFGLTASYKDKAQLANSLSLAEAAGSIGLRTQSIQLMRDAMYRLCEGYMAGAVDSLAFETLHRRFQSSMVTILAIEQLTGVTKAPTIVLGGSSGVGDPKAVADATEQAQEKKVALDQAAAAEAAAQKEYDPKRDALKALTDRKAQLDSMPQPLPAAEATERSGIDVKIKQAETDAEPFKTKLATATKLKSDAQAVYDNFEASRIAAVAGGGKAQADGRAYVDAGRSGPDAQAVKSISEAVQAMVESTLNLPFAREFCASVLMASQNPVATADGVDPATFVKFGNALGDVHIAQRSLAAAQAEKKKSEEITRLQSVLNEKRESLDTYRMMLMRPTSTAASCLAYINASTLMQFTETEVNSYIAQTSLANAEVKLLKARVFAAIVDDPNAKPDVKIDAALSLEKIAPEKTAEPSKVIHALEANSKTFSR